jgi:hypothetical protein
MRRWSLSLPMGLLLMAGPISSQILTVGGHPFVPSWGTGTLLRANDALPVYVVDGAKYRHILNGSTLTSCYDVHNIIWVFSLALHQTGVSPGPDLPGAPCPSAAAHSVGGFQELYEPGSEGARHVGMTAWTSADKTKAQGIIRWESDSDFQGVCGGAVVTLLDQRGALLDYYTPPTGCVSGKGAGHSNQRFEAWEDGIPSRQFKQQHPNTSYKDRITFVKTAVVFTSGTDKLEGFITNAVNAAKLIGSVVASFGGGDNESKN